MHAKERSFIFQHPDQAREMLNAVFASIVRQKPVQFVAGDQAVSVAILNDKFEICVQFLVRSNGDPSVSHSVDRIVRLITTRRWKPRLQLLCAKEPFTFVRKWSMRGACTVSQINGCCSLEGGYGCQSRYWCGKYRISMSLCRQQI